jgi:hypothetical protein
MKELDDLVKNTEIPMVNTSVLNEAEGAALVKKGHSGSVFIEGDTIARLKKCLSDKKNLENEEKSLKSELILAAKPAFYGLNAGQPSIRNKLELCDEEGETVSITIDATPKAVDFANKKGDLSDGNKFLRAVFGDSINMFYDTVEEVSFSLAILPIDDRIRVKKYLAEHGIPVKKKLIPKESLHVIGGAVIGKNGERLSPEQQVCIEERLKSRGFTIRQ